jgi:Flp pilus assembly protein TadG
MLVLLVPVFFGLMGFAVDLGRLYLAKGELRTAAEAMALSAAGKLIGTEVSTDDGTAAARLTYETGTGFGNKYDFGGLNIGESNGTLNSTVDDPTYFDTAAAAIGESDSGGGGEASGTTARHVRASVSGEAPLVFWSFLPLGQDRKTNIQVRAVAGISAPLCTACAIEPIAIAPLDATDTTDFGFTFNTKYTLGFSCTGAPAPAPLPGTTQRIQYLLLNRMNPDASVFADDNQQLYRTGAQGLIPNTSSALACFTVNNSEQIWATATTLACNATRVQTAVTSFLCGVATRLDPTLQTGCDTNIPESDTLSSLYQADTDLNDLDDYTAYVGNQRRLITVPIVDTLNPTGTMLVMGFRQFLVEPNQGTTTLAANDSDGRFSALYIGSLAPVRQGRFDGGCGLTTGPGKVVLHR